MNVFNYISLFIYYTHLYITILNLSLPLSFNISLFLFLYLVPCSLDTFTPLSTSRSLLTVLTKITSRFSLSFTLVVLLIPNSFSKLEVSLSTSLPNSSVFPSFILYLSL